jgi:hypothetical protein
MQAGTAQGKYLSYKRAWVETVYTGRRDQNTVEYAESLPQASYAGRDDQKVTVGFTTRADVPLGRAPKGKGAPVGGNAGLDLSYVGEISRSSTNWHPVWRADLASGGVQWCNYASQPHTGTIHVTTRTGIRWPMLYRGGPTWKFLTGQRHNTTGCPAQLQG